MKKIGTKPFFCSLSFSLFIFKSFQKLWLWFCCCQDDSNFVRWIFRVGSCCFNFNSRSWGSCPKIRYTLPCRPQWHPDSWLGCRGQQVHLQITKSLLIPNFLNIDKSTHKKVKKNMGQHKWQKQTHCCLLDFASIVKSNSHSRKFTRDCQKNKENSKNSENKVKINKNTVIEKTQKKSHLHFRSAKWDKNWSLDQWIYRRVQPWVCPKHWR